MSDISNEKHSVNYRTVKDILNKINDTYFLLDIQRDYKWDEERVVNLFDSLLQGYPIGTFLVWKIKVDEYNNQKAYNLYQFIDTVKKEKRSGSKVEKPYLPRKGKYVYAVIDGQQRFTSLHLALRGGYRLWRGRGRHSADLPPLRELYFSPAGRSPAVKTGKEKTKNEFAFFSAEEVEKGSGWYRVKDIYASKSPDDFCQKAGINKKPEKTKIKKLYQVLKQDDLISIIDLKKCTPDDAVNVFLRMNSGGIPLKKTELLFALAVNSWPDGRKEIEDFIENITKNNKVFGNWEGAIDKDFVLKTCLYLCEKNTISLSVKELQTVNFNIIKKSWEDIKESIQEALKFLDEKGYSSSVVKSTNAILPIVYYRHKNPKLFKNEQVKRELNKLFLISQLNGLFKQATDSVLYSIRETMDKYFKGKDFSFVKFYKKYSGEKNLLLCNKDTIREWVIGNEEREPFYKGEDTLLVLSALPENIDKGNYYYEQDHLHPKKNFSDADRRAELEKTGVSKQLIQEWDNNKDCLGNLQLCRDRQNRIKSGTFLSEWLKGDSSRKVTYDPAKKIKQDHRFIAGDDPYHMKYFDLFFEKRSQMIISALEKLLLK